ncbi:MAG: hypothetical protein DMF30_00345 [Verrucomicrobia bacterium]|nr:MAG: hypothetical protein DMF30_00345 [Verrucomicrobiota bacterium]
MASILDHLKFSVIICLCWSYAKQLIKLQLSMFSLDYVCSLAWALLAHSIDYAGMFPPCSLALEPAPASDGLIWPCGRRTFAPLGT